MDPAIKSRDDKLDGQNHSLRRVPPVTLWLDQGVHKGAMYSSPGSPKMTSVGLILTGGNTSFPMWQNHLPAVMATGSQDVGSRHASTGVRGLQ
jgi:hypothetical protein